MKSLLFSAVLWIGILIFPPAISATGDKTLGTEHFIFEFSARDEKIAGFLASRAEKIRSDLVYLIGYDFKARTRVILAPDRDSYARIQPRGIVPEWSVGVAFPRKNLIVMITEAPGGRPPDPLRVFKHELSHILLGKALSGKAPRWLDEGIAKHVSEPWTHGKTWDMTIAVLSGSKIPLDRLIHGWPKDEKSARIAYLESQAFVDYLFREAAVSVVVRELRRGASVEEALFAAGGAPIPDLARRFDRFLEENYTWVNILAGTNLLWGGMSLLFLLAVVISYFKSRRKLRRMELEDELEDLENTLESLGKTDRPGNNGPRPDNS